MRIATVMFTYCRSNHTQAVLQGLKSNHVLPEKLFIFQDGMKSTTDINEWSKVNDIIKTADFCPTEVIVANSNKGLLKSILEGLDYVIRLFDAFIVIEDDCVPDRNFINYMVQSLTRFEKDKNVYTICGYTYPEVSVPPDEYDVYFHGRFTCWGWGTWKDRWAQYDLHPSVLHKGLEDPVISCRIATWARDLPRMSLERLQGKNEGWDVYWGAIIIQNKGLCVTPYESLIKNIGFDGTGVHCGATHEYDVCLDNQNFKEFSYPKIIAIRDETRKAFLGTFGSYVVEQEKDDSVLERVIVYGLGNYYFTHEKVLAEHFYIEAYIDKAFHGFFAGRPILTDDMIENYKTFRIIIMLKDMKECVRIKEMLHSCFHISMENIVIGRELMKRIE